MLELLVKKCVVSNYIMALENFLPIFYIKKLSKLYYDTNINLTGKKKITIIHWNCYSNGNSDLCSCLNVLCIHIGMNFLCLI